MPEWCVVQASAATAYDVLGTNCNDVAIFSHCFTSIHMHKCKQKICFSRETSFARHRYGQVSVHL
jgi:hypothetical protein